MKSTGGIMEWLVPCLFVGNDELDNLAYARVPSGLDPL